MGQIRTRSGFKLHIGSLLIRYLQYHERNGVIIADNDKVDVNQNNISTAAYIPFSFTSRCNNA